MKLIRSWRRAQAGTTLTYALLTLMLWVFIAKQLGVDVSRTTAWYGLLLVAFLSIIVELAFLHFRQVELSRQLHGLHRYSQSIRNYAVANIEPLHESIASLKAVETPQPEESAPDQPNSEERTLGKRERETMLKLLIGMAIKGYSHDPAAAKSSAAKEIADDLAALGINVSDDTVRKYLKKAADTVLPANPRQS
ncbi:hypothetical protein LNV28_23980 [Paucibacter sp. DJ2R-2]|nr:hypothetical protein [Paucibacter sp. DJ4R-1]MCV2441345.1 hypothetical protein [Paucibacter sp. DJ2R-2]